MDWSNAALPEGEWVECSLSELDMKYIADIKAEVDGYDVKIILGDGTRYRMVHHSDCCENVYLADITGDIEDMKHALVLIAEEIVNSNAPTEDDYGSATWTFYKFQTSKGAVTLRFIGESNGYYSESVDFEKFIPTKEAV